MVGSEECRKVPGVADDRKIAFEMWEVKEAVRIERLKLVPAEDDENDEDEEIK